MLGSERAVTAEILVDAAHQVRQDRHGTETNPDDAIGEGFADLAVVGQQVGEDALADPSHAMHADMPGSPRDSVELLVSGRSAERGRAVEAGADGVAQRDEPVGPRQILRR